MSGDNQHFIPQQYLKGFKIQGISGGKRVWVYRQDVAPEMRYIDEVAADEHFYSPPAPGSLDDIITVYENKLAAHFKALRKAPIGPFVNGAVPAEVISHLTIRTESMRKGLSFAAQQMALQMFQTFSDEDAIRKLMELDGDGPGKLLKNMVDEMLDKHAEDLKRTGLSREAVERLAFGMAKERFPEIATAARRMVTAAAAHIHSGADDLVANAQKKALAKSLVPEERVAFLSSLSWEIIAGAEEVILPDCVSIALQPDGRPKPLILSDKDDIRAVIFPLNAKRLMIGRLTAEIEVRPALFNIHALSCAEAFVVSTTRNDKLTLWARHIGVVSKSTILEQLSEIFAGYAPEKVTPRRLTGEGAAFPLTFPPGSDVDIIAAVHQKMVAIVSWVVSQLTLDGVEGIIFSDTVPQTIADLFAAVGQVSSPVAPDTYAATVLTLKEDLVVAHIVLQSKIGLALLDESKPEFLPANYIVVKELAEANAQLQFDRSFPGIMLRPHASLFNLIRYEQVAKAWSGYLSSRFAGQIWLGEIDDRRKSVLETMGNLKASLPILGDRLRRTGDHSAALRDVLPFVAALLGHTAILAGLCDAGEQDMFSDAELMAMFKGVNLADWLKSYVSDLQEIWNRRGRWSSADGFLSLGRHTERVLWQCGIVLTEGPDGGCRIEFPNITPSAVS